MTFFVPMNELLSPTLVLAIYMIYVHVLTLNFMWIELTCDNVQSFFFCFFFYCHTQYNRIFLNWGYNPLSYTGFRSFLQRTQRHGTQHMQYTVSSCKFWKFKKISRCNLKRTLSLDSSSNFKHILSCFTII